jgi:hypothetical protein
MTVTGVYVSSDEETGTLRTGILACFLSVLLASPAWAATPTFDAATVDNTNNNVSTTGNVAHARGASCPSPVSIIRVTWQDGTPATLNSVTADGNAATALDAAFGATANIRARWYIYLNPPSGSINYVANWSESVNDAILSITTYCNVLQSTTQGTVAAPTTGSSTTPSVNVSSAAGELVIDFLVSGPRTLTADGSQTERVDSTVAGNHSQGGSEEAGAASVTMSWTLSSASDWAITGVSLKPSINRRPIPPIFFD